MLAERGQKVPLFEIARQRMLTPEQAAWFLEFAKNRGYLTGTPDQSPSEAGPKEHEDPEDYEDPEDGEDPEDHEDLRSRAPQRRGRRGRGRKAGRRKRTSASGRLSSSRVGKKRSRGGKPASQGATPPRRVRKKRRARAGQCPYCGSTDYTEYELEGFAVGATCARCKKGFDARTGRGQETSAGQAITIAVVLIVFAVVFILLVLALEERDEPRGGPGRTPGTYVPVHRGGK